jgi:hypothetical protein
MSPRTRIGMRGVNRSSGPQSLASSVIRLGGKVLASCCRQKVISLPVHRDLTAFLPGATLPIREGVPHLRSQLQWYPISGPGWTGLSMLTSKCDDYDTSPIIPSGDNAVCRH